MLAAKERAVFEHRHLMLDSAPLAQQDGVGLEFAHGDDSNRPALTHIVGDLFEQAVRGGASPPGVRSFMR
ncbi:MAG: hypothetical protein ACREQR_12305 [Candidatus Binataceae bacterium]